MQGNRFVTITLIAISTVILMPGRLYAQQSRYRLVDLGTLGGPQSYLNNGNDGSFSVSLLNKRGILAGSADTVAVDSFPDFCFNDDCYASHAFQWQNGVVTDLGALADGVSSTSNWISATGLIAGTSENGELDPLLPNFPENRAVLWRKGRIIDLGTLPQGGYESVGNAVNSRGELIGFALDAIPDSNSLACPGFCPTQTRAFLWQGGVMQDLGTLGGPDALAQFINEQGQIVGWSYTSSDPNTSCPSVFSLTIGSFIWDKQTGMKSVGTLGGTCTIATGLNNRGMVVGNDVSNDQIQRAFLWNNNSIQDLGGTAAGSDTAGEAVNDNGEIAGFAVFPGDAVGHAALWRKVGDITDLGAVDQDTFSFASAINSTTQIVGASVPGNDFTEARAFLWENGSISDLNTLIPPRSSLHLQWAEGINDHGEIAGSGLDTAGNVHVFLLIPCISNSPSDCQEVFAGTTSATRGSYGAAPKQPGSNQNSIQQLLRRRLVPGPHMLKPTMALSRPKSISATATGTSLTITSGYPPSGTVGRLYDVRCAQIPPCNVLLAGFPVRAAGGVQPYSWKWTAQSGSTLPPGLLFPDTSGYECLIVAPPHICGKPTKAGYYNVIVTVTDSESPPSHASTRYTIHIFP